MHFTTCLFSFPHLNCGSILPVLRSYCLYLAFLTPLGLAARNVLSSCLLSPPNVLAFAMLHIYTASPLCAHRRCEHERHRQTSSVIVDICEFFEYDSSVTDDVTESTGSTPYIPDTFVWFFLFQGRCFFCAVESFLWSFQGKTLCSISL